jgi:hypothetical protein
MDVRGFAKLGLMRIIENPLWPNRKPINWFVLAILFALSVVILAILSLE